MQTGGETPEQKLARYQAQYGAVKGKQLFDSEFVNNQSKTAYVKPKEKYKPSDAVNQTKAALSAASLANWYNPAISYPLQIAGSVYDAGTAINYALDSNWGKAGEDGLQAVVGVLPEISNIGTGLAKLNKAKSKLNLIANGFRTASDIDNIIEAPYVDSNHYSTIPLPKTSYIDFSNIKSTDKPVQDQLVNMNRKRMQTGGKITLPGYTLPEIVVRPDRANQRVLNQNALIQQSLTPNQNYAVIDKNADSIYYFNPQGRYLTGEPVITGRSQNDIDRGMSMKQFFKATGTKDHEKYFQYLNQIGAQTTPSGAFTINNLRTNTADNPDKLGNLYNKIFRPERYDEIRASRLRDYGAQQQMFTLTDKSTGKGSSKAIHGTLNPLRVAAFEEGTSRSLSNGCINVNGQTVCFDTMHPGSNVYILPQQSQNLINPITGQPAVPSNIPYQNNTQITNPNFTSGVFQQGGMINDNLYQMKKGGLSRKQDYGSKKKPYPSVKSSDFAGGGRSYPIPTRADAVDALRLAGLHHRPDVKAKVYRKYPDLKKWDGGVIYQMGGMPSLENAPVNPFQVNTDYSSLNNGTTAYNFGITNGELGVTAANYIANLLSTSHDKKMQNAYMTSWMQKYQQPSTLVNPYAFGDPNQMKSGGIHINPANKGKFTATKKRTGKSTEELTHSKNPLTRRRAIFAQNARKWHHEDGGMVYALGGPFFSGVGVRYQTGGAAVPMQQLQNVQTYDPYEQDKLMYLQRISNQYGVPTRDIHMTRINDVVGDQSGTRYIDYTFLNPQTNSYTTLRPMLESKRVGTPIAKKQKGGKIARTAAEQGAGYYANPDASYIHFPGQGQRTFVPGPFPLLVQDSNGIQALGNYPISTYGPVTEYPMFKKGGEVKKSVDAVNDSQATVEAEKGEYILGIGNPKDLTSEGSNIGIGLYKINGNKHYNGGTKLNANPGDFIFSDDKTLAVSKDIAKDLVDKNISKVKGRTPAGLVSTYGNLNDFIKTAQDKNATSIDRKTAMLNTENILNKLADIAILQEAQKGFPTGIPAFAKVSLETRLAPSAQDQGNTTEQQMASSLPQAKYGGQLYQTGGAIINPGDYYKTPTMTGLAQARSQMNFNNAYVAPMPPTGYRPPVPVVYQQPGVIGPGFGGVRNGQFTYNAPAPFVPYTTALSDPSTLPVGDEGYDPRSNYDPGSNWNPIPGTSITPQIDTSINPPSMQSAPYSDLTTIPGRSVGDPTIPSTIGAAPSIPLTNNTPGQPLTSRDYNTPVNMNIAELYGLAAANKRYPARYPTAQYFYEGDNIDATLNSGFRDLSYQPYLNNIQRQLNTYDSNNSGYGPVSSARNSYAFTQALNAQNNAIGQTLQTNLQRRDQLNQALAQNQALKGQYRLNLQDKYINQVEMVNNNLENASKARYANTSQLLNSFVNRAYTQKYSNAFLDNFEIDPNGNIRQRGDVNLKNQILQGSQSNQMGSQLQYLERVLKLMQQYGIKNSSFVDDVLKPVINPR